MVSRHLSAVPDDGQPATSGGETFAAFADRVLADAGVELRARVMREHPARFRRPGLTLLGELVVEAPGWWVCPTCGRRVDRAGEARTITGRSCTGPDGAARHRRHPLVAMVVQR